MQVPLKVQRKSPDTNLTGRTCTNNSASAAVEVGVLQNVSSESPLFSGVLGFGIDPQRIPMHCRSKFHTHMSSSLNVTRRSRVLNFWGLVFKGGLTP